MKKLIISPFLLTALVFLSGGCKKSSNLSETWNWKGATYTSTSCTETASTNAGYGNVTTLTVQQGSSTLQVIFNGPLPTQSVTDTVIAWGLGPGTTANEVNISLGENGTTYQSTGGCCGTQTLNVTVSGGKLTVSIPQSNPAELLNIASGSVDSSGIYFSIVQQN